MFAAQERIESTRIDWRGYLPGGLILCGMMATAWHNYLLFHTLAELFSIIIGFSFFVVVWNGRRFLNHHFLLFLGIAFLFIGLLDLIHSMTYQGMSVLKEPNNDYPVQLWMAARFLEALSFLGAFHFIRNRVSEPIVLASFTTVVTLILLSSA